MEEKVLHCPRCDGEMDKGYKAVYHDVFTNRQEWWSPGEIKFSFWSRTNVKVDQRQILQVITYRCKDCGYLESYANQPA